MDKVIKVINDIMTVFARFDVSFEKMADGKIKICVIIDPKNLK